MTELKDPLRNECEQEPMVKAEQPRELTLEEVRAVAGGPIIINDM